MADLSVKGLPVPSLVYVPAIPTPRRPATLAGDEYTVAEYVPAMPDRVTH